MDWKSCLDAVEAAMRGGGETGRRGGLAVFRACGKLILAPGFAKTTLSALLGFEILRRSKAEDQN